MSHRAFRGRARSRAVSSFSLLLVTALTAGLLVALPTSPASAGFCVQRGNMWICFEGTPSPPQESCPDASCLPAGTLAVPIEGYVRDPRGEPIGGATVYWQYGTVSTNSSGYYRIEVWADKSVTLYAKHSLHHWREKYIAAPVAASPLPQNFEGEEALPFLLGTLVTPKYFNVVPTSTVVEAYTSAPPEAGVGIAELDSGSILQLVLDTEAVLSPGWHRWYGQIDVPSGTPDGSYGYRACVVASGQPLDCDGPLSAVISQVKADAYVLDRSPPNPATWPPRFADVLKLSSISATWLDGLSGIDSGSLKMWVDGTPLPVSVSGTTASTEASSIAPGIHLVVVEGADLAGNLRRESFIFTLTTISSSDASATLVETTVRVNPNGSIPPPTKVTFPTPLVDVGPFSSTLNATTWVGYGSISRSFSLGSVEVVFMNETGVPASVTVPTPPGTAVHHIATLAPSAGQLKASIAASQTTIPNVVVSVPTGYSTPGSTATLKPVSAQLGPPVLPPGQFLQNQIDDPTPVVGSISACLERPSLESTTNQCRVDQQSEVSAYIAGVGPRVVGVPVRANWPDPDPDGTYPNCTLASDPFQAGCMNETGTLTQRDPIDAYQASAIFGCPLYRYVQQDGSEVSLNLCTGEVNPATLPPQDGWGAAYLNAFVYAEKHSDGQLRYPVWQQNHLDVGVDLCPNGKARNVAGLPERQVAAKAFRAATSLVFLHRTSDFLSGSPDLLLAGTWAYDPGAQTTVTVTLGAETGPEEDGVLRLKNEAYRLKNAYGLLARSGKSFTPYQILKGYTVDGLGQRLANPAAVANRWDWDIDKSLATSLAEGAAPQVQLATGAELRVPSAAGGYAVSATLAFQLIADFGPCAG